MRNVIQQIPDGVYTGDDVLDGEKATDSLVPMRVRTVG